MNAISPLRADDAEGVRQVLAIYQQAIEPSEQKPAARFAAHIADPRYLTVVSRDIAGAVGGFALMAFLAGDRFWLLEYLAIREDQRAHGAGAALFNAAAAAAQRRAPGALCVLEVDQPDAPKTAGNDPVRRLKFYRNLGCRKIGGLSYLLPLDHAGAPPPMQLLIHGRADETALAHEDASDIVRALYTEVYAQAGDDPRIAAMLAPSAGRAFALEPL